jgi:ABC-type transport system involved in multi-copper enzyme maturation permease subunit
MDFTVMTFSRVMTDIGLGVMSTISAFLSVFLSTGQLPREIDRRTIYMIASRPISRSTFLVGRYLGNVLVVYIVLLAMTALFLAQLFVFHEDVTQSHVAALIGIACEVALLSAVGSAFAAMSSQLVSASITIGFFFMGHLLPDIQRMGQKSSVLLIRGLAKASPYLIPDFDRLDLKMRATYRVATAWTELGQSFVYTVGYAAIALGLACLVFERRDFR